MKEKKYILILLSFLFTITGCIDEDYSDCEKGIYINFKTLNPKYEYTEIVENVEIHLYDVQNNLVNNYTYSRNQLEGSEYKAYIPEQKAGNYSTVAVVNMSDSYKISNKEYENSFLLEVLTDPKDSIQKKLPDIYHSIKEISFGRLNPQDELMELSKNTNHIDVTVIFEDDILSPGKKLNAYIKGSNGIYNANNKSVGKTPITYCAHFNEKKEDDSYLFSFTTLRLWIGDDLKLSIVEEGEETSRILNELMITEEIAKLTNSSGEKIYDTDEKLEFEDEFKIKIMIDNTGMIGLKINDWYAVYPGFVF